MLKSLELFGFKSFADRTRFDFDPGMTGVVGPNGSGKSNVVDAIKWILGVQSAKSLRGKSMTDVIFNGAKGRKASGFAEATLTFDNASGFLPIEDVEVQVGRRIYQNGESEYLLNRAPVRLKDVVKLFLGTGSTAYCIIEQGRVDQILQANAATRRKVFEEAAGISRFKADKAEAERKLTRVDQNLLRLTDIVDEVEAQLDSLRTQAAKAAKFRELSAELRTVWLGLAADEHRHLSEKLGEVDATLAERLAEIETLGAEHQQVESRLAALDAELAQAEDRLRDAERRAAANRQALATQENTARHQTERTHDLEADLTRLRRQAAALANRAREGVAEHERLQAQLKRSDGDAAAREAELDARTERLAVLQSELATAKEQLELRRREFADRERTHAELVRRVAGLESQRDVADETRAALEQRRRELVERIALARAECERRQTVIADLDDGHAATERRLDELRSQRRTAIGELDEAQQRLAEQRERRSAGEARRSVLEDLESRQEGLGIGVKEILSRAATSDYAPWKHILGSVADLLDVDLEHAALLEVALGNRAQLIVVEEMNSLIEYLGSGTCRISGRVGFLLYSIDRATESTTDAELQAEEDVASTSVTPHDAVCERFRLEHAALPDLTDRPGVLGRADRVVRCPEAIPRLAEQLLADTWIVETLPVALELAAEAGRGCRFVTLQGELVEADGTLFVGTVRSETALVSRKSELRRLKNDLLRLDRRIQDEERRRTDVGDALGRIDQGVADVEAELQEWVDRLAETRSELSAHERDLERFRRDEETLDGETARLVAQQGTLFEQIDESARERERVERESQERRTALVDDELALTELDGRLQQAQRDCNAAQLEIVTHRERLDGQRATVRRLGEDLLQRVAQHEEAVRRLDAALDRRRQATLHLLDTSSSLAESHLAAERLEREVRERQTEKDHVRSLRARLVADETRVRGARRERQEQQHRDELAARDLRFQIESLHARIEEEFQEKLADVVESGASAFQAHCAEQAERSRSRSRSRAASPSETDATDADEPIDDDEAEAVARDGTGDEAELRFEDVREEIQARVDRLRRKLKLMGSVNTDSLRDLDELERRFGHLSEQLQDLQFAKSELEEIVKRIDGECQRLFAETFTAIRGHFQGLFRGLFGGGEGDIVLEDPDDILECGIDIVARPPGKELRSITLLSGGEKTMTAVAMLMAIFQSRPSPFCILDEVDAALDEANVERFVSVVKEFSKSTQFLMITHRKPSMVSCDVLYGVTMEQSGVSKRMSVRFEDIGENGEIRGGSGSASDAA